MNQILTDNEKLARVVTGVENDGLTLNMKSTQSIQDQLDNQARVKYNQEVGDYVEKLSKHQELLDEYAERFKDSMEGLEIMPVYRYMLIAPFASNPFTAVKREGLIITDYGMAPEYRSNETGEWEEEESWVHVGTVLEVGPKVEYVRPGDVVMYPKTAEVAVPFYKQGFVICDEQRTIAVVNENLKSRFQNV